MEQRGTQKGPPRIRTLTRWPYGLQALTTHLAENWILLLAPYLYSLAAISSLALYLSWTGKSN